MVTFEELLHSVRYEQEVLLRVLMQKRLVSQAEVKAVRRELVGKRGR